MIRRLLQSLTASLIVAGSASAATYEELSKYAFNTFEMPDGTMVNYRVEGEKSQQTILLVHGGGDSLSVWNRWAAELTKKYRVIRLDMPGHGLSDPYPDGRYTTPKIAESINTFVNGLGLNNFALVGHSYGGEASLHYITKYPEKVVALGLVAAGAYEPKWEDIKDYVESFNQELAPGKEGIRQSLKIMFGNPDRLDDEIVDYLYDLSQYGPNQNTLQAMENASMDKYQEVSGVENIKVPTLLIWGDQDKVSNLKNIGERLHREIPRSKLIVYRGVGHMPNYAIAKKTVQDFIKFLNENL